MQYDNRVTGDEFLSLLEEKPKPVKLGYIFREGVNTLSYSRLNTLHSCPRKFRIGELRGARNFNPSIDTAFGHAYGAGVQSYLVHQDRNRALLDAMAAYDYPDIWEVKTTSKKSLWHAAIAIDLFINTIAPSILRDFKVATYNGKPAVELFFLLQINPEYDYQGHIDLVLESLETGELYIFELKTGGQSTQPADWQNSSQTLGYNAILHAGNPESTNFNVLYMHYNTKAMEHTSFAFTKTSAARAEFIATLLMQVQILELYKQADFWPKNGNACTAYGKPCYLFGTCDSELHMQAENPSYECLSMEDADIHISLQQLLDAPSSDVDWDNFTTEEN